MCADNNINRAIAQFSDNFVRFLVRTKTRQHFDGHGERGEPFFECVVMLLRQNRRRHKDRDLPPIHDRLAWRVDNLRVAIQRYFNPPEEVVFTPQEQIEVIVQARS